MIHKNRRPVWESPETDFLMKALPCVQMTLRSDRHHRGCKVQLVDVGICCSTAAIYQLRVPPSAAAPSSPQQLACNFPNPRVFRGGRKEEVSVISQRTRELFQQCHMGLGRACVYIYCTLWGLGHTPPRCFTLGTKVLLHPAPIKEHKELFDSLYKPNTTNNCIVYCLIPLGCHDSVQHTTGCVIDCSVLCLFWESNDLYRPLLTKCEL